ncbi:hypothetical protein FQN53_005813 [Emmonsiellopsis sp. PD_33]|nr:hypothetical protein FQN53_005813 [Emmonsiellopsis sp. PD_33]
MESTRNEQQPLPTTVEADIDSEAPSYTVFTTRQKKWIVFIAASAGWFSTASSFIYFPAIPFLARDLGASVQEINLTVSSYLIASGIFPSIWGNFADHYGRRPVFIMSIGAYIAINIGLAVQRSFAALVTLRMLQSMAISDDVQGGTHSLIRAGGGDLKRLTNPFTAFGLLKNYGTAVSVACFGVYYTIYSCLQASLSTIFVEIYAVSRLVAGLSYMPFGIACMLGSSLAGKLLDYDYTRTAESLSLTIDRRKGDDLRAFPIEYARLRTCKYFIALCAPLIIGYGWALQSKVVSPKLRDEAKSPELAISLLTILQFFIGFTNQVNFTSLNALLVDFHPHQPSAIQGASNFVRCELAAGGIALLDLLLRTLGPGWCFTVFASLHVITLPALWVLEACGLSWRKKQSGERK